MHVPSRFAVEAGAASPALRFWRAVHARELKDRRRSSHVKPYPLSVLVMIRGALERAGEDWGELRAALQSSLL